MKRIKFTKTNIEKLEHPTGKKPAVKNSGSALQYADDSLKNDPDILELVG